MCASGPVSRPGERIAGPRQGRRGTSHRFRAPTAFLNAANRIASTGVPQVRDAGFRRSASTFEKVGVRDPEV